MLQVLCEIILSILCVYGGYRLLHDLERRLESALNRRYARRASGRPQEGNPPDMPDMPESPESPDTTEDREGNPAKGGEEAEHTGKDE